MSSLKQTRVSAVHLVSSPNSQCVRRVPIWVYEVNNNHIFSVKFEYKERGYKGLRFSDVSHKIEYLN
jgi:hypothetical protein